MSRPTAQLENRNNPGLIAILTEVEPN